MGLFDLLKGADINSVAEELEKEKNAVLLDVRTPQEYKEGHIPDSRNIPLDQIHKAKGIVKDKGAPVYVYCHSGGRSRMAAAELRRKQKSVHLVESIFLRFPFQVDKDHAF